jgi:hypothetical protein
MDDLQPNPAFVTLEAVDAAPAATPVVKTPDAASSSVAAPASTPAFATQPSPSAKP